MTDLTKSITVRADGTQAKAELQTVKRTIADLNAAAGQAGRQAGAGLQQVGTGAGEAAGKVDAATRSIVGSIQRQIAAVEAGGRGTASYYASLASAKGIDTAAIRPYLDQLDAVNAKTRQVGVSAAQTAAAMRGLPAQMTDVFVSLGSGQQPLTVLLQQGGQLKDMFGGVAPAARAVGGAVAGLINPMTLTAAAAVALAVAYKQGSDEADAYRSALILSGNAAGVTAGQLAGMARQMATGATTQHAAAEALAAFAGSTQVAGADIAKFAGVALAMQRSTGTAIGDTVKVFEDLGKSPAEASRKLSESLNYLSAATYAQIRALQEQGRESEAARVAQTAYADAMTARTGEIERGLGLLQRAWRDVVGDAKKAWDAMLDIGRAETVEDKIAALQTKIADAVARKARTGGDGLLGQMLGKLSDGQVAGAQAELQRLQAVKGFDDAFAAQEARNKATQQAGIAARDYFDKLQAGQKTTANLTRALAEYDRQLEALRKSGQAVPDAAQQGKDRQDIRDKYTDDSVRKARLDKDLDAIRRNADEQVKVYADVQARAEVLRQTTATSDAEYYASKRALIESESQAQQQSAQQQMARLQREKVHGATAIEIQKQIAALRIQASDQGAAAATKLWTLDQQEAAGIRAKRAEMLAYVQQLNEANEAQQRSQQRELSGIGTGAQARATTAGLDQITDKYSAQRRRLADERAQAETRGTFGADQLDAYTAKLRDLDAAEQASTNSYREYWAAKQEATASFADGAREAFANYKASANENFKAAEDLTGKTFKGMEDLMVDFVTKGKADFKGFVTSILADLTRIQARKALSGLLGGESSGGGDGGVGIVSQIIGAIGAAYGTGYTVDTSVAGNTGGITSDTVLPNSLRGGRASGGAVDAGALYQVNERGPELLTVGGRDYLMMGGQGGYVTPNGGGASGGGQPVTVHLNATVGDVVTSAQLAQFGATVKAATMQALAESARRSR